MRGKDGYYYPNTIKKMAAAAIGMFNDIIVYKYDSRGNILKQVEVPVIFGSQKWVHRARTNEEQKEYVPTFPRIEVRLDGFIMDDNRLVSPLTKRFWDTQNLSLKKVDNEGVVLTELNDSFTDFNPLPYNYQFTVSIFSESVDYMSQIVENIFPYFDMANSTMRIKEFDFLNIERDINVVLGNPDIQIGGESMGATDRRTADVKFSMEMQGWMYRKVSSAKLVNTITVLFSDDDKSITISNHNKSFIIEVEKTLESNQVSTLTALPYDELKRVYLLTDAPINPFPLFSEPKVQHKQIAAERAVMIDAINNFMETKESVRIRNSN